MRVLVIENYPKTTLGLVGEALAEAGAEMPRRSHACRRSAAGDATTDYDALDHARRRAGCARRREPSLPAATRRRSPAPSARPTRRCSASASARRFVARALRRRRTFSAGRSSSAGTRCARPKPAAPIRCSRRSATAAPIFHWHLDTFTLPPGAVHLATSEQTPMQAFRIGRAVYGIQFHFEAGTELVDELDARLRRGDRRLRAGLAGAPPGEAAKHGAAADAAGLALARAWIGLIARPSPSRQDPAKKGRKATVSEWST